VSAAVIPSSWCILQIEFPALNLDIEAVDTCILAAVRDMHIPHCKPMLENHAQTEYELPHRGGIALKDRNSPRYVGRYVEDRVGGSLHYGKVIRCWRARVKGASCW
jgi:hypothetical protein